MEHTTAAVSAWTFCIADATDHTPIVAELKLPRDKDPYFALIQALACTAHLATANQYARMREQLCDKWFPMREHAPQLDVWILFVEPQGANVATRQRDATCRI
jgi:hypothetical protein